MKKLILLLLIIPNIIYSQLYDYKIKVEIDNSAQYRYDEAYYRASIDQSNKEIADGIKGYADKYFTTLRRNADYVNEQNLNSPEVEAEFKRLQNYGEEILKLLPQINSNEISGNKMVNTIEKAFEELSYSNSKQGKLYKLMLKNSLVKKFSKFSNEDIVILIKNYTGETIESINNKCVANLNFHDCLVNNLVTTAMLSQ